MTRLTQQTRRVHIVRKFIAMWKFIWRWVERVGALWPLVGGTVASVVAAVAGYLGKYPAYEIAVAAFLVFVAGAGLVRLGFSFADRSSRKKTGGAMLTKVHAAPRVGIALEQHIIEQVKKTEAIADARAEELRALQQQLQELNDKHAMLRRRHSMSENSVKRWSELFDEYRAIHEPIADGYYDATDVIEVIDRALTEDYDPPRGLLPYVEYVNAKPRSAEEKIGRAQDAILAFRGRRASNSHPKRESAVARWFTKTDPPKLTDGGDPNSQP